ncbi:muconolactone Delta-isomerase [Parasphingopyxis algicola]|uniref:muconolactone Delta-isomerase n=1 Tax=Parasphingopyxis algicola TaxID=2026624 RepID=UPI0015A04F8B|nr:muconolactone Delta-isomerase [Parasphingopyxis algicola]QLC25059.1 muconolactone Delta-isomerase [Parasphingopyxis algicola]
MLYHVEMTVCIPADADGEAIEKLKAEEKAIALSLQQKGLWRHLWRIAGAYANISIFDVDDHDQLHRILSGLPLFPYMEMEVTPLALHPSALDAGESQ